MSEVIYEKVPEETLKVIDFDQLKMADGHLNVDEDEILAHVKHSIRLGHPQCQYNEPKPHRICLVGGGPSLAATEKELVALLHEGAFLVTMNGSYQWALERNLRPSTQIILDARASNARFLDPPVPNCRYLLASQCHPDVFKAAEGRNVWIFHAADPDTSLVAEELNRYYLKHWHGVLGGTTVASRGLVLLNMLGYLRFDLFGVDCCWSGDRHHAFSQPENDRDGTIEVQCQWPGDDHAARIFKCSPSHIKQFEDFLQLIRVNGERFVLNVHGDGMLAYAIERGAADVQVVMTKE